MNRRIDRGKGDWQGTYPRDDGLVASEVGLATLAADDVVRVQVDVVLEAHLSGPPQRCGGTVARFKGRESSRLKQILCPFSAFGGEGMMCDLELLD